MKAVALIPARAGSKRVPGKNMRLLNGHPLIAYTIAAALESGCFDAIWVCSDDDRVFDYVLKHTPNNVHYRSRPMVADDQADIVWVKDALHTDAAAHLGFSNIFAILRPTSPFRTADTIRRAMAEFKRNEVHSLRAVEPVKQHPGKMWWNNGPGYPMTPVCDAKRSDGTPWHSCPTQTLPQAYVQNASLEIAWTYVVEGYGSISGKKIMPFLTEGMEGFDINTEEDWKLAEAYAHHSEVRTS